MRQEKSKALAMSKTRLVLLFIGCTHLAQAQDDPVPVDITFWATDALGNVDSVILKYEEGALCGRQTIEAERGERHDSTLFGLKPIDLRIGEYASFKDSILYDVFVLPPIDEYDISIPSGCSTGRPTLFVEAEHQPVTISWNPQIFRDTRWIHQGYITNDGWPLLLSPYDGFNAEFAAQFGTDWAFFSDEDRITFNTDSIGSAQNIIAKDFRFSDGSKKPVYGIRLALVDWLTPEFDPCCPEYVFTSSITDLALDVSTSTFSDGRVKLSGLHAGAYDLTWFTTQGQMISRHEIQSQTPTQEHWANPTAGTRQACVLHILDLKTGRSAAVMTVWP